jgi:hypothetical protein
VTINRDVPVLGGRPRAKTYAQARGAVVLPTGPDRVLTIADMSDFPFPSAPAPLTVDDSTDAGQYQPGVCNIGPADIAFRRRSGHVSVAAAAGLLGVLLAARAPRLARLLVAIPAAGAASGYIQARSHFCAGYGSAGVFNFGSLGSQQKVTDDAARALDAARARRIGRQSLAIGLAVAGLAVALPELPERRRP